MQIGVLVCDADGHPHLGNQAAQKFLGQALASGKLSPLTAVSPSLARIQLFRWLGEEQSSGRVLIVFTTRAGYAKSCPGSWRLARTRAAGALIFPRGHGGTTNNRRNS